MDCLINGYHHIDNPEILCVSYHLPTCNLFTGGNDRTVRFRKLSNEHDIKILSDHCDAVCYVEATRNYLLSGDESGEIILWLIEMAHSSCHDYTNSYRSANGINADIGGVVAVCRWPTHLDRVITRALCQIVEIDDTLFVLQAGVMGYILIWKVEVSHRVHADGIDETVESGVISKPQRMNVDIHNLPQTEDREFILCPHNNPNDMSLRVLKYAQIMLENVECSTIQMTCQSAMSTNSNLHSKAVSDTNCVLIPRFVYVGTTDGPVLRYDIESHRLRIFLSALDINLVNAVTTGRLYCYSHQRRAGVISRGQLLIISSLPPMDV